MRAIAFLCTCLALASCETALPEHGHEPSQASALIAQAATSFLESLNEQQRAAAQLSFEDVERERWTFLPQISAGVLLGDLSADQSAAMHQLLSTTLSDAGHQKTTTIIQLEQMLHDVAQAAGRTQQAEFRDPGRYSLAFFGDPARAQPWGFRLQGHHISWNFSSIDGSLAPTPAFLGAYPAEVSEGPLAGLRALPDEEDLAREFMRSLSENQRNLAVISDSAPGDLFWALGRTKDAIGAVRGLEYGALSLDQRAVLWRLICTYAGNLTSELATAELAKIDAAGRDNIRFAWMGSETRGEGHYYRVQGPTFVIEYDNVQDHANHVHSAWHDLTNDFGGDSLREHRAHQHSPDSTK